MDADSIIILGLCIILLIVLILLYIKDKQTDTKFDRYDQIMTDNMNGLFTLQKEINLLKEVVDEISIGDFSDKIDEQIEEKITPIIRSLKGIDELIQQGLRDREKSIE